MPHHDIVPLIEGRTGDLSVVPPITSLRRDDICTELIDTTIEMHRFGKVIPARRDLTDGLRIRNDQSVCSGRDDDEAITAKLTEGIVEFFPRKVRLGESVIDNGESAR